MDVARPYSAIVPSVDGDVLVALAGTTRPLTGRQVAELARRGSQRAVSNVLDRLVDQGLVLRQKAGAAHLHTLNRDHIAAPIAELLAGLRAELFERIGRHTTEWDPLPLNVTLFGSTARGDGDITSDIDLLVVRGARIDDDDEGWRAQVDALSQAIHTWTGNHAAIVEVTVDELPRLVRRGRPIVHDLRTDGIDLAGSTLRSLLRRAERDA